MKKHFLYMTMILVLMGMLTACSTGGQTTKETEAAQTETEGETEIVYDESLRYKAYQEVLSTFRSEGALPNGYFIELDEGNDINSNVFAVFDIDKDGRDELMIRYTSGSMASMTEVIYDYSFSQEMLYQQFQDFPNLTYFKNGVIEAGISHNQGLAGDFWPYAYYIYNPDRDVFVREGFADALDAALISSSSDVVFPEQADEDGDGVVYLITNSEMDKEPMDGSAYEAWRRELVGDGSTIVPAYISLTEENIAAVTNLHQ